jgi:ribA/ribD-fused uncharacterized protein
MTTDTDAKALMDGFDDLAETWLALEPIKRMTQAVASVFSKWANEDIMVRFRQHITTVTHQAFVEGCIAGVRAERARAALSPSTDQTQPSGNSGELPSSPPMVPARPAETLSDEEAEKELRLLYNYSHDDSPQFTRWQMVCAIHHGMNIEKRKSRVEAEDTIESVNVEIETLRSSWAALDTAEGRRELINRAGDLREQLQRAVDGGYSPSRTKHLCDQARFMLSQCTTTIAKMELSVPAPPVEGNGQRVIDGLKQAIDQVRSSVPAPPVQPGGQGDGAWSDDAVERALDAYEEHWRQFSDDARLICVRDMRRGLIAAAAPPPSPKEIVDFYEREFYPLSNFSAFTLDWYGQRFDTSEAAYHWMKFPPATEPREFYAERQRLLWAIQAAPSAHEAFKLAERNKDLRRPDWDDIKVDVMRRIIRAKAEQHEYVRRKLLETGDRPLIEGSWRDDFWGIGPNKDGQNMLGKLWMELRAELSMGSQP